MRRWVNTARWGGLVALIYALVFIFQAKVVFPLEGLLYPQLAAVASLVYLPHAARVLATIIVGPKAFFPLFGIMMLIDYFLSATVSGQFSMLLVLASLIGASCAPFGYIVVKTVGERLTGRAVDLQNWRAVLAIGVIASLYNSVLRAVAYHRLYDVDEVTMVAAKVIIGDTVGLMLGLVVLLFFFRMASGGRLNR